MKKNKQIKTTNVSIVLSNGDTVKYEDVKKCEIKKNCIFICLKDIDMDMIIPLNTALAITVKRNVIDNNNEHLEKGI